MDEVFNSTVTALKKKGFRVNRVTPDCVYMLKRKGPSTFYAEVDLSDDGEITVNGGTLKELIANL